MGRLTDCGTGIEVVFMRSLTDGVINIGQASPKVVLDEQAMQLGESRHRRLRWSQGKDRANCLVQHPASDCDDDPVTHFNVYEFAIGTALAIHATQTSAVQRMPTVEDLNILPDMGTMNRNWPLGARTGCLPAVYARANGQQRS